MHEFTRKFYIVNKQPLMNHIDFLFFCTCTNPLHKDIGNLF